MKKILKIIGETEFLVQKRGGGWDGWIIYARHKIWSKFSTVFEQEEEPKLTDQIKERVVVAAMTEQDNWKHNGPIWRELSSVSQYMEEYIHDFGFIFLRDSGVKEIVIKALEANCEDVKTNEALQRLQDANERYEKYCALKKSLKSSRIKV